MGKVYVGDVGTIIRANIGVDVTGMLWGRLYVKKPNGSDPVVWECTVDPEDSTKIRYVTQPGDVDDFGMYLIMSRVKKDGWGPLWGDTFEWIVHAKWK